MGNCITANPLELLHGDKCKNYCLSWLSWCGDWRRGDLVLSGVLADSCGLPISGANGVYQLHGEHHGCPVYRHSREAFFIYYWDDTDGPTWRGWWLGPTVGSATVWAYCGGPQGPAPPESGWHVPWNGPIDTQIRLRIPRPLKIHGRRLNSKALPESPLAWLLQPGRPEFLAELTEDPTELQTCCICLEPLWKARPSVFLVNLKRLCPHYFCYDCAQRVIGEGTRLVKFFEEQMKLALVDGLAVVLDMHGEQVGDLVWKSNGSRVSEGEFAVMIEQLGRFEDPEAGMELRFAEGQAVVLRDGERYGRLLRSTARSLRALSQEDFEADRLGGVIASDSAIALRGKYTVLHEGGGTWACERCTMDNPASKFWCRLCYAAPPRPARPPESSRPLMAPELAALRSRFAVRPRINWAVQLQCPLCRTQGCASLAALPDLRKAPHAWFRLADLNSSGHLSPSELAHALAAVLPISPERLRLQLEGKVQELGGVPKAPSGISLTSFLRERGPAHWAVQQLAELKVPADVASTSLDAHCHRE